MPSIATITIIEDNFERIYVANRPPTAKKYIDLLDVSSEGFAEGGEGHEDNALRMLTRNLGISARQLEFLFQIKRGDERNYPLEIYRLQFTGEIIPLRDIKGSWMDRDQIDKLVTRNQLTPNSKAAYERYKSQNQ